MDKYQNDLNGIPVAIIIEDGVNEVKEYIEEKIISLGGYPIKVKDLYNNYSVTIIYTHMLEDVRKNVIDNGFHQVFWSNTLSENNNIFIAFNSKKYILGLYGTLDVLEKTIYKNLRDMINQIKLIKGDKHVDKKDSNYSMWGKR